MLTQFGERQALFIGHLNPSRISNVFVRKDTRQHSWQKVSAAEFLSTCTKQAKTKKLFLHDDEFTVDGLIDGL